MTEIQQTKRNQKDECLCGDYREDHHGDTGACKLGSLCTPFGCRKFRLAFRAGERDAMSRVRASLPQPPAGSTGENAAYDPLDWVLVPRKPTPEMLTAKLKSATHPDGRLESRHDLREWIWGAMIKAAPLLPSASTPAQSGLVELLEKIGRVQPDGFLERSDDYRHGFSDAIATYTPVFTAIRFLSRAPSQPAPRCQATLPADPPMDCQAPDCPCASQPAPANEKGIGIK